MVQPRPGQVEGVPGAHVAELKDDKEALHLLEQKGNEGTVTLVYASHDEEHNGAMVLKRYLEHHKR